VWIGSRFGCQLRSRSSAALRISRPASTFSKTGWASPGTIGVSSRLGEYNLFLGALNSRGEVDVVGFLELLTSLGSLSVQSLGYDQRGRLTILVSCASATKLWASARTSSCSSWTILVLCGSLYFSLAISSETYTSLVSQSLSYGVKISRTFALWSLLGCTELSVFLICFNTPLYSSNCCA
jgi:hypothetical protein